MFQCLRIFDTSQGYIHSCPMPLTISLLKFNIIPVLYDHTNKAFTDHYQHGDTID